MPTHPIWWTVRAFSDIFAGLVLGCLEEAHKIGVIVGLAELKQRVADLENINVQHSEMLTVVVEDLYRFCHDSYDRQITKRSCSFRGD